MGPNVLRRVLPRALTLLALSAIFCSGGLLPVVLGATNPVNEVTPVFYLDGEGQGPPYTLYITQELVAFNPDPEFTNWCEENHRTAAGNKFYHAHTVNKLPRYDNSRNPPVLVTAQMCDYFWDNEFCVEDPPDVGWDRKEGSTATTAYNCHGFALRDGLFWIRDTGQEKIIEDEYTWIYSPVAGCVASWSEHSFKVLAIVEEQPPWEFDLITHIEQKFNSSAIYQFHDAWGVAWGLGNWYRKD